MTLLTKPLLLDVDIIKEKSIIMRYIRRGFVAKNIRINYRHWNNFTLVGFMQIWNLELRIV